MRFPYFLFILLVVVTFCLNCLLPHLSFIEAMITMAQIMWGVAWDMTLIKKHS